MACSALAVIALMVSAAAVALANQSPINIRSANAIRDDNLNVKPLTFKHYQSSRNQYFIQNTGHGCQITLKNWKYKPSVRNGPLPNTFILKQLHFHWGMSDGVGSEHYLDSKPFSMEAHLVHWNSKYKSYSEAASKDDGLAVIGFFIEGLSNYKNPEFQKIVREIPKITKINNSTKPESVEADLLTWVIPNLEPNGYYTYNGSLTTPPYSENVMWILFENPVIIGKSQIQPFREIENDHEELLESNFRMLQNSKGVSVKYAPTRA